jgi:hypothetical protein
MEFERLRERLATVEWNTEPYSHFYQTDVFSPEFYAEMLFNLPSDFEYRQYNTKYAKRYLYDMATPKTFWSKVDQLFRDVYGNNIRTQLCRDFGGYSIGPHTDGRKESKTILFYLPKDDSQPYLGTSVYVPKDKQFTCDGTKHHDFDKFNRVNTAPYVPNTCFGFIRSDNSFHGVEPHSSTRNLIQVSVWR